MWNTEWPTPPTPIDYGIYRKQSLGLISLSSDWETWITIADKNLGANQVYSYWDEYTQNNSWKYYQRWNNYGFPFWSPETYTGTIIRNSIDTTWYGQWNYYSSSTFVCSDNWLYPDNRALWEGQGPAPTWYHVPTATEFQRIVQTLWNIYLPSPYAPIDTTNRTCMKTYLKMPAVWIRIRSTSNISGKWNQWCYWMSNYASNWPRYRWFYSGWNSYGVGYNATWCSIRCIKDTAVTPDSSWTEVVANARGWGWIYHNSSLELISLSSDWINWITIQDKNLWATVVYNNWDTLSEANCWKYYQRWNCYWFPFTGWVQIYEPRPAVAWYGPWNYYSSDAFVDFYAGWQQNLSPWYKDNNPNLWWWVTDTDVAKKWPCWDWFHICSHTEAENVWWMLYDFWLNNKESYERYLLLPWWTSVTATQESLERCWMFAFHESWTSGTIEIVSNWFFIRPFKNEPVEPDSTRTKLF